MSYDGSDDKEAVKRALVHDENYNNDYYIVSSSESKVEVEENIFEGQIEDKIEVTPKTKLNPKVARVIKNLQALYNEDAKKIVGQAATSYERKFEFFD